MAVNFNLPTVDTTYTAFPTQIIENIDAALQQLSVGSHSNVPTGAIKWHSGQNRWKKYNGSSYENLTDTYNLAAAVNVTQLNLGDDEKIRLGNSNDIQLFHRGSDGVSILQESAGGYLSFQSNGDRIEMYDTANGRTMAEFFTGGACRFKHGATIRLQTTSSGATVTGDLTTTGSASIGESFSLDGSTGGTRNIKVGQGRTANAYSFIDLIGDATYTTYGARFIRSNTGPNAPTSIQHRGTGALQLTAFDAAPINLITSGSTRFSIESGGDVGVGLTNPTFKFQVYSGNANACKIGTTTNGANLELADNDTISQFRTVDGRLHIAADTGGSIAESQIRFQVDGGTKMLVDHGGGVGIGTGNDAPNRLLQINSNGEQAIIRLANTDTTITDGQRLGRLEFHGSDAGASGVASFVEAVANGSGGAADLRFGIGTAASAFEAARFDSSGRLLIGKDSNVNSRVGDSNFQPDLQIHSDSQGAMSLTRYVNGTACGRVHIQKGRGTKASPANINTNDNLGEITFSGYHGSNFRNGARISAKCASASNSMPSDLIFEITNDSGTLTQNMIITHDRFVGINENTPLFPLHVKQLSDNAGVFRLEDSGSNNRHLTVDVTNNVASLTGRGQNSYGIIRFQRDNGTATVENCRSANDGNFLIGTTTSEGNARLTVNGGNVVSNTAVVAGFAGTGQAALSVNDGGGNCNICFNHLNTYTDSAGVAGRITVNTDASNGANNVAGMDFQLHENVSSGSQPTLTSGFSIHRGRASQLDGSGNTVYSQVRIPDGASDGSVIGLAFTNDIDTGIVRTGGNALGISCGNNLRLETSAAHGTKIEGELNLISFDNVNRLKYLDVGIGTSSSDEFNIRRTSGGDANHGVAIKIKGNLVVQGDFNDTSDRKLKKNVVALADGAITLVKKLKPVTFDWIEETRENNVSGFIAQDVLKVIPNLVNGTEYDPTLNDPEKGTKGGIKSDGYSINTIGVLAHVTKALQEAISKIETLETEVAALKSA